MNQKTVIDLAPSDVSSPKGVARKFSFKNLTNGQKSLLQAAAAGVGGVSLGALSMAFINAKPIDGTDENAIPIKGQNDVEICIYSDAPFSDAVNDQMTFSNAFSAARNDVGAGGFFEWRGNTYNTYKKEEWDQMSLDQKNDFIASIDHDHPINSDYSDDEILDIVNDTNDIVIIPEPNPDPILDPDPIPDPGPIPEHIVVIEDDDIPINDVSQDDSLLDDEIVLG